MRSSGARPTENLAGLEDAELARLAGQRHREAFRLIIERNNRRLYRVARSILKDDAEAEDVVSRSTSLPLASWQNSAPTPGLPPGSRVLPSTKHWDGCAADARASSFRRSTPHPSPTPRAVP